MPGTCRKRWNEYFGVSKQGIKNRAGHVGCKFALDPPNLPVTRCLAECRNFEIVKLSPYCK